MSEYPEKLRKVLLCSELDSFESEEILEMLIQSSEPEGDKSFEYEEIKEKLIQKYGKALFSSSRGAAPFTRYKTGWTFTSTNITLLYLPILGLITVDYLEAAKDIEDNL